MIGRDIDRLRKVHDQAVAAGRTLEGKPFKEPRISLQIGEALQAVSRLEAWVSEALWIAETELYHGPK